MLTALPPVLAFLAQEASVALKFIDSFFSLLKADFVGCRVTKLKVLWDL